MKTLFEFNWTDRGGIQRPIRLVKDEVGAYHFHEVRGVGTFRVISVDGRAWSSADRMLLALARAIDAREENPVDQGANRERSER